MISSRFGTFAFAALTLTALSAAAAPREEVGSLGWGQGLSQETFVIHRWPDPVNAKNANFFLPNKDISYPAPGFPLDELQRIVHDPADGNIRQAGQRLVLPRPAHRFFGGVHMSHFRSGSRGSQRGKSGISKKV